MIKAPCIDCMHRYPACHSHCELYKAYHEQMEAKGEAVRAAKARELQANQVKEDGVSRSRGR